MNKYKPEVRKLSDLISERAPNEAECFPIDRYFLEEFLEEIEKVDKGQFLLYNLENLNNTYTVQLLLCLPELWDELYVNDIECLIKDFSNIFSFYALIVFCYKYVEINIIDLILGMNDIRAEFKEGVKSYLQSQYPNLLKSDTDYRFLDEGILGVNGDSWTYIKQKLLVDRRITPSLKSIDKLEDYVKTLVSAPE